MFALSAGIAGFGGALYATQLTSITPNNFDLVSSLQVFALTVVGGIGAVGGALFGAASLLVLLPLLATLLPSIARWVVLLPGGTGIALGRNPNGAVHDMREGFAPLLRVAAASSAATVVGLVGVYALRLGDVISNWPFVSLEIAVFVIGDRGREPAQPAHRRGSCGRARGRARRRRRSSGGASTGPWTESDR